MIRAVSIWVSLLIIMACGVIALWLDTSLWQPNAPRPHGVYGLILLFAPMVAFLTIFITPAWIAVSRSIVKRAIENAYNKNYDRVQTAFLNAGWIIFPLPKYAETVRILRHLGRDRKTKPEGLSPEFSECLALDGSGEYVLSLEGKAKMLKIVNTGWFSAKKAEDLSSPKILKLLAALVVAVAIIRGVALIFQLFSRH